LQTLGIAPKLAEGFTGRMMRSALHLIAAVAIIEQASAQSTPLIENFDQTRIRQIVTAAGFPVATQAGTRWFVPKGKPLVLPNGEILKPGTEIRMAGAYDLFQGPDHLVFSADPSAEGFILSAKVPLPMGVDANAFMEVFNITNPTVKLYVRGQELVCDRYVQLKGGVTETYLRESIRSYVASASTLMDAGGN
jgi:hypothetical protein